MGLETAHLAAIIVIPLSDSEWILKLVCKSKMRNRTFTSFKLYSQKVFINDKGKSSNFLVEGPERYTRG